jgi:hypothetical protein
MRSLAAGCSPAQATAIYAACRRNVREGTGMTPSNETERVFRQIAGQESGALASISRTQNDAPGQMPRRIAAEFRKLGLISESSPPDCP